MKRLQEVLLRQVPDTPRSRSYQTHIDSTVDGLADDFEGGRGVRAPTDLQLPHETVEGYWELPQEERAALTSPEAQTHYRRVAGRNTGYSLGLMAFAWHSPLSRHHHSRRLLTIIQDCIREFARAVASDGDWRLYGLNAALNSSQNWGHGWDVEGFIYALVFTGDGLDPEVRALAEDRFHRSAEAYLACQGRGTEGNQGSVYGLGLLLYGLYYEDQRFLDEWREHWSRVAPLVLDKSGQVIEQYGPCCHYSYTAVSYAWLNCFVSGDEQWDDRLEKCLNWFRHRHTDSLYAFPGPSSRQWKDRIGAASDILMVCEHLSARNPLYCDFADRIIGQAGMGRAGHGCGTSMWALLAMPEHVPPVTQDHRSQWEAPFEAYYEGIDLLRRSPLRYLLKKERYQTSVNINDYLPFGGIQAWALGEEPPIVYPTINAPSCTQCLGIDTARHSTSHNWSMIGCGLMSTDRRWRSADLGYDPSTLLTRQANFLTTYVFTEMSTVILYCGGNGPRRTCWTLNRHEPAEITVEPGKVSFAGREAKVYSATGDPKVITVPATPEGDSVRILEYANDGEPSAFAFSNDSFRFDSFEGDELRFSDETGSYRVMVCQALIEAAGGMEAELSRSLWDEDNQWHAERTAGKPRDLSLVTSYPD